MLTLAILAGGLATRLRPLTETIPKSMIDICGKPFVHWQVKLLSKAGVRDIVYCVSYKSEMIKEYLGDGSQYGVKIRYSHDGLQNLGTGGALVKALPLLGRKFMVLYGDSYLPIDYFKVGQKYMDSEKMALMTVYCNNGEFDSSNVLFEKGLVVRYEKGSKLPEFKYIDYGLSCFDSSIFLQCPKDLPIDLAQFYDGLISQDQLFGFEVGERFYEIGSRQGIMDFTNHIEGENNDF